jgi:hypothetical protein
MNKIASLLICVLVIIALTGCTKSEPANAEKPPETTTPQPSQMVEKLDLKLFYAGNPGSKREKAFVVFLSQHFSEVKTGDLEIFNGSQAVGADVTILDYDGDPFNAPVPPIDENYRAPTLTIGVVGAHICSGLARVTGYM